VLLCLFEKFKSEYKSTYFLDRWIDMSCFLCLLWIALLNLEPFLIAQDDLLVLSRKCPIYILN